MTDKIEFHHVVDVHIRRADGQDLILSVSPEHNSIGDVKRLIRQKTPDIANKNIRLIYNGRILDDARYIKDYQIGKVVSDPNAKGKQPGPAPVFIHCAVSDHVVHAPGSQTQAQTSRLTGFDRLREAGFNEEEIRRIRTQFHRMHGTAFDGEPTEQARQLEEQWIDSTGETLPDGTIQGAYKEMMWGLVLGFFLGVLCLFWLRESVFTRRHQMGILVGMLINVSFGVLHVYY